MINLSELLRILAREKELGQLPSAGRMVQFGNVRVRSDIICTIRDQGIGIPEADRERLFNAFHRGRNVAERPGTGLGLVIAKRCVDLPDGRTRLASP